MLLCAGAKERSAWGVESPGTVVHPATSPMMETTARVVVTVFRGVVCIGTDADTGVTVECPPRRECRAGCLRGLCHWCLRRRKVLAQPPEPLGRWIVRRSMTCVLVPRLR